MTEILENDGQTVLVYADVIKTRKANETFDRCTPSGMFRWHDWSRRTLLDEGCFIGPQPVWRRSVHDEYGYFDERYTVSADYEFWLRISQTNDFFHLAKPMGLYMERSDSIEHANPSKRRQEDMEITRRYRQAEADGIPIGPPAGAGPSRAVVSEGNVKTNMRGGNLMNSTDTITDAIRHLLDDERNEAAVWAMEKLLEDVPGNAGLHNEAGQLAYMLGDMPRAGKHFEQAASLDSSNTGFLKALADFHYVARNDPGKALDIYRRIVDIDADHTEALIMAGHVSVSLHRYRQARSYYQRAHRLAPENAEITAILKKLSDPPGEPERVEASADRLYADAQTKAQAGDRSGAIALLERLISRDGGHAAAFNDLGVMHYENGAVQDALANYEKAVELEPQNEIYQKNLADFLWFQMADPRRAMQHYVQALKLDPQDVEAQLACSQICMSLGRTDDARAFIETVLAIEPWNENARKLMGRLERYAENAAAGGDPTSTPNMTGSDRNGEEIAALERSLDETPNNAVAQNNLGVRYYEAGDKARAVECYERAVRLDPGSATYAKNLADFYLLEQGRAEDAMKLYLRTLELDPEDIEALIAIGNICTKMQKCEDARFFFQRVLEIEPWNDPARAGLEAATCGSSESVSKTAVG
jgi:tetratricopeptide (TPR) repeat protein